MNNLLDFDLYAKILVGLTGLIVTLNKLRDSFSTIKKKQELKLDLEILEKLKGNNELYDSRIEDKIKDNLKKSFEANSENITNFFIGITFFITCGFWTIDILKSSDHFNGWTILSLSFSLIGLSMIFDNNEKYKEKEVFYKIGFYDKVNFRSNLIISLFSLMLTIILILKMNEFSFWQLIPGVFFIVGLLNAFKYIKRLK